MRVARRPPWRHNGRQPHEGVVEDRLTWPEAFTCVTLGTPRAVQLYGYMDELIRSEHLVVPREHEVYAAQWLEVVDMDDWLLWRVTGDRARREMARVRQYGVDIPMLYLGCFRVDRLDRESVTRIKQRAKKAEWNQ